jgi:hypothetical protein
MDGVKGFGAHALQSECVYCLALGSNVPVGENLGTAERALGQLGRAVRAHDMVAVEGHVERTFT